jgi:dihydropteroate synthase
MGVLNVTPDSFSDGGRFSTLPAALDEARRLIAAGADILDIGGESTRPGAAPVAEAEELSRVIPLIEALRRETDAALSIDTMKPGVARAAVAAGATTWNDVTALSFSPESLATAAALGCEVVLMHMRGSPATMLREAVYDDVVAEVCAILAERAAAAMVAGVSRARIQLDPGIGFGKDHGHNLTLLAHMNEITALGFPVVLGVSRKRFVRRLDPSADDPRDRLGGSIAAALAGARAGVAVIRTHDVRETRQALLIQAAIDAAGEAP